MHDYTFDAGDLRLFLSRLDVATAVGITDRQAASVSHAAHQAHLIDDERLEALVPVRFASVVGEIPTKVCQAVGGSMTWDKELLVPVMELTAEEYPGPIPRLPSEFPEDELSPDKLRFAGAMVFDFLTLAGKEPRLKYVMNDDIRRYMLMIVIPITAVTAGREDFFRL